jgi:hypothetical protein
MHIKHAHSHFIFLVYLTLINCIRYVALIGRMTVND